MEYGGCGIEFFVGEEPLVLDVLRDGGYYWERHCGCRSAVLFAGANCVDLWGSRFGGLGTAGDMPDLANCVVQVALLGSIRGLNGARGMALQRAFSVVIAVGKRSCLLATIFRSMLLVLEGMTGENIIR